MVRFRPDLPSDTTLATQTLDGGQNSQDPALAGVEAVGYMLSCFTGGRAEETLQNLDIQYTVGLASNVPTTFTSVGGAQQDQVFGFMDIIQFFLNQTAPPQVLTTSYGANESLISPMLVQ